MILGRGLRLAGLGIALGFAAALGLTLFLAGMLYGVTAYDARTLAAACLPLVRISALASYLPARKAAGVDPLESLRHE